MLPILARRHLQDLVRAIVEPDRNPYRSGEYVQGAGEGAERRLRFAGRGPTVFSYVRDGEPTGSFHHPKQAILSFWLYVDLFWIFVMRRTDCSLKSVKLQWVV
jgi:hypothetical protein